MNGDVDSYPAPVCLEEGMKDGCGSLTPTHDKCDGGADACCTENKTGTYGLFIREPAHKNVKVESRGSCKPGPTKHATVPTNGVCSGTVV